MKEFENIIEMLEALKANSASGGKLDNSLFRRFEAAVSEPQWEPFYGYNHNKLPDFGIIAGGGVRFAAHLGKELTKRLWEDLTVRLRVESIQIYRYGEGVPCVAANNNSVQIHLDVNGNVTDIYYTPNNCSTI